jgi:ribosomal protein S18 acetylase RimI-like enzyme
MDLEYRSAGEQDIEILYNFNKKLIDSYEDTENIEYDKVLIWVRKKIEKNINEYTRVTLDGKTVGYFNFYKTDGGYEIDDLYVLPEYRGQGIGTEIIKKCIEKSDEPLFLYVFVKNIGAVSLYERLGFRIISDIRGTRYFMKREN